MHNMAQHKMPIGVFDSGVGGLSVLKHIAARLPHEDLLYVADSRHAPYGNKPADFIRQRAFVLADFLIAQGAKALVVACNTATAEAVAQLRKRYSLPIIAMEPAVKPAVAATRTGVVGVLATVGTLKSAQFAALLEHYGQQVRVVTQACHGLVECIERGELTEDSTRDLLMLYVKPLLEAAADTIVLGCTHYPLVRPLLEKMLSEKIVLIDTGDAVARQVQVRLQDAGLLSDAEVPGKQLFWSNSDAPDAAAIMKKLWGNDVKVTPFPHEDAAEFDFS